MNSNAVYEKYIIDNFLEMEQRDLPVEFKIAQNIIFFRSHQDIDRNDVSTIAKLKSEGKEKQIQKDYLQKLPE